MFFVLPFARSSHYVASMTQPFDPKLDILPAAQRRLWDELGDTPPEFVLYGGTALALRLGHRKSVDFDFFCARPFDPGELLERISYLKNAKIVQNEANTLSVTVQRRGPVKLSFFGVPRLRRVGEIAKAPVTRIKIASLLDLAGTKAAVVQRRAEAKDYIDIAAILSEGSVDLSFALAGALAIYGPQFNPQSTLKALVFFEEGNLKDFLKPLGNGLSGSTQYRSFKIASLDRQEVRSRTEAVRQIPLTPEIPGSQGGSFGSSRRALHSPILYASWLTPLLVQLMRTWQSSGVTFGAELAEALDHAPPGIIDKRSWAYWNLKIGRFPAPPLPQRQLD